MGATSNSLGNYIHEISRIGEEFGPMLVKGMILLLIVLIVAKYLVRLLAPLLVKVGVSDHKAAYSVTGLHILVLLIGTIVVLGMVGFQRSASGHPDGGSDSQIKQHGLHNLPLLH